jgi:hypothetical protein
VCIYVDKVVRHGIAGAVQVLKPLLAGTELNTWSYPEDVGSSLRQAVCTYLEDVGQAASFVILWCAELPEDLGDVPDFAAGCMWVLNLIRTLQMVAESAVVTEPSEQAMSLHSQVIGRYAHPRLST